MADPVKWRTGGIALGATLVVALGGAWAANATGIFERPAPTPTAVIQEETTPTPTVTPTPTPTPTVDPIVEEAPVEPPAPAEPEYGSYPSGYPVPFVPSSDPENANGGEWAVDACAAGSASTGADGVPYCD